MDEQQIRDRAYALWEQDGKPDGQHDEHWHRATRELTSGDGDVGAHATGSAAGGDSSNQAGSGSDAGPENGGPSDTVGLATSLQPGGTIPGGSPAAGVGSIGTGGGSTANRPTGAAAKQAK